MNEILLQNYREFPFRYDFQDFSSTVQESNDDVADQSENVENDAEEIVENLRRAGVANLVIN